MVKNKLSSAKNWKESIWETALWSVNSSHRVSAFPSWSLSQRLFLWNFQSDIWKTLEGYGEKEVSSDKNRKEAFCETALCSVNSSHSVTGFPSRSRWLRLFFCNIQSDIWKTIEGDGEKENIFIKNWKEVFWKTALYSGNSSHRVTHFPSRSLSLRLFLWNLEPAEGCGEKGNIFR